MRIHLISPTHYLRDGSLHKTTRYWTSGITLPYLKALTPPPNQVTFTDELMADLDLERVEREADVVGLTAMGPQIRRAYDLADHFRARGKQVVLGGTWVSLVPEESLRHADAVVAGEAEYVWQDVLADLAAGRSRGIYRAARWHDLANLPAIDWWSLPLLKADAFRTSWLYRQYFFWPVFFSRGFESLSEESLASVAKSFNRPSRFKEDIEKLRARGIQVIALIMVGLDGDTPETFAATLRWLEENKIAFLKLFTPAPYPGTKFHADMLAAGRLLDGDWGHYDYGSPVVRPLHMTAEQMLDGFRYVYAGFYSVRSMLRRFVPPARKNLLETLAMVIANTKVNGYLRRNPEAWGTIS